MILKSNFWNEKKLNGHEKNPPPKHLGAWNLAVICSSCHDVVSFQVTRKFDNNLGMYTFIFLLDWSHWEPYLGIEGIHIIYSLFFYIWPNYLGWPVLPKGLLIFWGIDTAGTYHDEISQINWCMSHYLRRIWNNNGGILLGDIMPAVGCTWLMVLGLGGQKTVQTNGLRWPDVSPQEILNTIKG